MMPKALHEIANMLTGRLRWTDLSTLGLSPITRIISITPIVSTFLFFANEQYFKGHEEHLIPTVLAFIGLFIFGTGSIIFNLSCPRLIKNYPNPADFMQLHGLFVKEGFSGMRASLEDTGRELDTLINETHALEDLSMRGIPKDEGFMEEGFRRACEAKGNSEEDRIRVLWYFHLTTNHCRAPLRLFIALLFAVGGILIFVPSMLTLGSAVSFLF